MSKVVNFSSACLIWLASFLGGQNVFAQKGHFSPVEKEIYSRSLAALKFENAYPKRFGIGPSLFTYIDVYLKGSSQNEVNTYIRENNWGFIKEAPKTKSTQPTEYFQSKLLIKHPDSVIMYDKSNATNVFSPIFYDPQAKRAIVVYEHKQGEKNRNSLNYGILFFQKLDDKWKLIRNITQFELF